MSPLGTAYRPDGRLGLAPAFLMLWLVALALWPGQWSIPVTDRDEARYSQAATQMMETGDYVDIRFQDKPRYVKPAGIYWMQVVSTQPFGGSSAPIGAYRLPSYLGVLLTALGTALIGARMVGGAYGAFAGALFGLTLMAGVEGRIAKTDAMLVAAGTFAQWGLFNILVQPKGAPPRAFVGWPLLFWAASGLAVLIKGPIFTLFTLGTIIIYVALTRDWRALRRLRPLWGLLVFALVGLTWVALISLQTDGAFLRESIGHALLGKVAEGDDDHGGWPGYYLSLLPIAFWPGTVFLGLGFVAAIRRCREPAVIFLLGWIVPGWLVYELVGTKLPHYVMPAYPAIALLCAIGMRDVVRAGGFGSLSGGAKLAAILALIGAAIVGLALVVALYLGIEDVGASFVTPWNLGLVGSVLLVTLTSLVIGARPDLRSAAWAVMPVLAFYAIFAEGAAPRLHELWPSHSIWQVASRIEGCQDDLRFATAGYREPSNVFYLGTETRLGEVTDAAALLRSEPACGVAIVEARQMAAFGEALGPVPVKALATVRGTNVSKGRQLELTIIVRADGPLRLADEPPTSPRRL